MTATRALATLLWRSLLALFLVTLLSWLLVECSPGTSAERAAIASRALVPGDLRLSPAMRADIVEQATQDFELTRTPVHRALRALRFDFGPSWRDGHSVSHTLLSWEGLVTLGLSLAALLLALIIGVWGAARSGQEQGGLSRKLWSVSTTLALSVPLPWLAMVTIDTLAYGRPLALFPSGGSSAGMGFVLPLLVMASAPAAVVWRHAHQEMLRLSQEPWVVAARARGNDESRIWRRLIVRASLPQILPLVPVLLAYLLAASVIVERVFSLDGIGEQLTGAAQAGDAPMLIGIAALSALAIGMSSSLVEVLIAGVDPRRARQ